MLSNYYWPILGGVLIGLSSTLLLLMIGRIAGISGIVWGAMAKDSNDSRWRWAFIIGIVVGSWLFHSISGKANPMVNDHYIMAAIAGLLVGLGVKIGSGCTSGHGVCGIGRLSPRSLTATITFMFTAIVTVLIMNTLVLGGLS